VVIGFLNLQLRKYKIEDAFVIAVILEAARELTGSDGSTREKHC
jgi:hypothetical protein